MLPAEKAPVQREWKAELELGFSVQQGRTVLKHRKHLGPLVVQRPFYPEGNVCHVYVIHPPGGIVGGDDLKLDVELEENSHVLITTPSAGKFYRSGQLKGRQVQTLKIQEGALLEWFPQETIFFNGCYSELLTRIELQQGAMFCGWEINCLGRLAAKENYLDGLIQQRIQLLRDDKPLVLENNQLQGSDAVLKARCGLNNNTVFATMLATDMNTEICQQLQEAWHTSGQQLSVTLIQDVLVCRYLGNSAEQAKKVFTEVWRSIRQQQKQLTICKPRIWAT